jgi:hypothetical protein
MMGYRLTQIFSISLVVRTVVLRETKARNIGRDLEFKYDFDSVAQSSRYP